MLNISRGKIIKPLRVIVYGPEGIGKSTFAAQFPDPVFIDTEGSTNHMDVCRFDPPKDWNVFLAELNDVKQTPGDIKTLVVDTADWAVRLCEEHICKRYGKTGIEDFGYGKGYVYAKEEWAKALDTMTEIIDRGVNVVLTAHSIIRKFEKPDEAGAYDRYELKMGSKAGSAIAALCKEWCDLLLFANYKEIVVEINGKKKAQGGSRVMFTSHAPTWDAKNRLGLKSELPFDYKEIAAFVPDLGAKPKPTTPEDAFGAKPVSNKKAAEIEDIIQKAPNQTQGASTVAAQQTLAASAKPAGDDQPRDGVDKRILDLCDSHGVALNEVSKALQDMGQAPGFFPVKDFPPPIVDAVVVHWQEVLAQIENSRVPF